MNLDVVELAGRFLRAGRRRSNVQQGNDMQTPDLILRTLQGQNWEIALGAFVAGVLVLAGILAGFFGTDSRL